MPRYESPVLIESSYIQFAGDRVPDAAPSGKARIFFDSTQASAGSLRISPARLLAKEGSSTSSFVGLLQGRLASDVQITSDSGQNERGITSWMEPSTGAGLARTFRAEEALAVIPVADTQVWTGALQASSLGSFYRGDSAGSAASVIGLNVQAGKQTGSGALSAVRGILVEVGNFTAGSGAITDAWGIRVTDARLDGTATITNQYGIQIDSQTKGGTLNRSIISLGGTAEFRTGADANVGLLVKQNSGSQSGALLSLANSAGTAIVSFAGAGHLTFTEGINVILGTTTGTVFGTVGGAAGQKMAWWGASPAVQPVMATGSGKTVDNLLTMLQTMGLCRQS